MNRPLVSVVVPAYNAEKYLSAALDSLADQQYEHLDVMVINDRSKDRTEEVALGHRIGCRYFFQENRGPAATRNVGIQNALGSYVAFLDADDLFVSGKLGAQVDFLESHPEVEIVVSAIQRTDEELKVSKRPISTFLFGAALIRKSVFDRVGLCNPHYIRGEDLDWYLRAKDLGISIVHQKEIGLLYRQHPGTQMSDEPLNLKYFYLALKESSRRNVHAKAN